MSALKIHLDAAERAAVDRYAERLHVRPEEVAYAALNRLMLQADQPQTMAEIQQTRSWRAQNLPLWSDSAGSPHAYASGAGELPTANRRV